MDIGVAIIVAALLISWRLDDIAEALRKNDDDDETSWKRYTCSLKKKIMDNKLMTLDGLIERLTELREIARKDCPIVVGKSFDSKKERMKITLVSLDSSPKKGKQHVAFLVENLPVHPVFICDNMGNKFNSAYYCFEAENPDWRDDLTDSTYYEVAEWYDEFLGIANSESLSDDAYKFADYVWHKLNL